MPHATPPEQPTIGSGTWSGTATRTSIEAFAPAFPGGLKSVRKLQRRWCMRSETWHAALGAAYLSLAFLGGLGFKASWADTRDLYLGVVGACVVVGLLYWWAMSRE